MLDRGSHTNFFAIASGAESGCIFLYDNQGRGKTRNIETEEEWLWEAAGNGSFDESYKWVRHGNSDFGSKYRVVLVVPEGRERCILKGNLANE